MGARNVMIFDSTMKSYCILGMPQIVFFKQHSVCCDEAKQHGSTFQSLDLISITKSCSAMLFVYPPLLIFNRGSYCSWLYLLCVLRLISEPILMIHVHIFEDPFGMQQGDVVKS